MSELHKLLGELRQFVDAVAGENRPSREWAIDLRTKIDAIAAERALAERAGRVKVGDLVSIIALWSDDEGLDLSFGQGDDLARRILSAITTEPVAPASSEDLTASEQASKDASEVSARHRPEIERVVRNALSQAAPEGRQDDEPRAYIVHAPEDDYYGTGPDRLQFHPLAQHDMDNGYRQTPLYTRPAEQAVTEALLDLVSRAREIIPDHYVNWHALASALAQKEEGR